MEDNFGILDFLIFDSFDELESIRLTLIWIELDWISNWTKIPKPSPWPNWIYALMSWIFDFVTLDVCEIIWDGDLMSIVGSIGLKPNRTQNPSFGRDL